MNVWREIASVASATPLLAIFLHLGFSAPATAQETWRVTDIEPSARIHMRQQPNNRSQVIAYIPGDARRLSGGLCTDGWCKVEYNGMKGWVFARYLAPDSPPRAKKTTAAIPSDGGARDQGTTAALARTVTAEESKSLDKAVPVAAQVPVQTAAALSGLGDLGTKSYTLAGLGGQNALAMRENPDGASPILGWIPDGANNVEGLRKCVEKWCLVRHGNASGWVARRHLADVAVESTQIFQARGVELWGSLDVLDYPNAAGTVVGKIPSYATGIVPIGGCDDDWCHVRYLGVAGWVSGQFLEPQPR